MINNSQSPPDRILRFQEVCKLVGLSKRTIYQMEQDDTFPKHVRLNKRAIGWKYNEIMRWIEDKK